MANTNFLIPKPVTMLSGNLLEARAYQLGATPNYYANFGIKEAETCKCIAAALKDSILNKFGKFTEISDYEVRLSTAAQAIAEEKERASIKSAGLDASEAARIREFSQKNIDNLAKFNGIIKVSSNYAPTYQESIGGVISTMSPSDVAARGADLFYPGGEYYLLVNLFAYRLTGIKKRDGVKMSATGILLYRHGTPLYSRGNNTEVFKGLVTDSEVNPVESFFADESW